MRYGLSSDGAVIKLQLSPISKSKMGSKQCKQCNGPSAEREYDLGPVDAWFPVQTESVLKLDWNDARSIYFQVIANGHHNFALGKIPHAEEALGRHDPKRRCRHSLKFADNIEQRIEFDDSNTSESD